MKKAFTLIELLIVIVIIGILAVAALPQYQKMVERSKSAEALSNIGSMRKAQLTYYMEYGQYAMEPTYLDVEFGNFENRTTKNFVYATDISSSGGRDFTVAAWTNTGTLARAAGGKPQYHTHGTGDIMKTEVIGGMQVSTMHDHNDGNGPHQHRIVSNFVFAI